MLIINAGSSSIKYAIYAAPQLIALESGIIEHVGEHQVTQHNWRDKNRKDYSKQLSLQSFSDVFHYLLNKINNEFNISVVGHRVVHGGSEFVQPQRLDSAVIERLKELTALAPLHNPANIAGIEQSIKCLPDIDQYAVFDTAFHQTLPDYAYHYALPNSVTQPLAIRRYGFHGISHRHSATLAAAALGKSLQEISLISLHLGNGASAAAIRHGECIDTTMGMSPLEGLIMGTRCGDLDPGIILMLLRQGYNDAQLSEMLNYQSGLKGICGDNDMREITRKAEGGDDNAELAIKMFCYRVKKTIGAYVAILGTVDALTFTGGIGQHSAIIRSQICQDLDGLGIILDEALNACQDDTECMTLHHNNSTRAILRIKADEEREIASQVLPFFSTS